MVIATPCYHIQYVDGCRNIVVASDIEEAIKLVREYRGNKYPIKKITKLDTLSLTFKEDVE